MLSSIRICFKLFSNRSICLIDGTLTDTNTPRLGGPGSYGNEGVLHTPRAAELES